MLIVGDNTGPARRNAEIVERAVSASSGFKAVLREVPHTRCSRSTARVPKAKVALCPNLGWIKDFADAGTVLDPLFNPTNIVPQGNVNAAVPRQQHRRRRSTPPRRCRPASSASRRGRTSTARSRPGAQRALHLGQVSGRRARPTSRWSTSCGTRARSTYTWSLAEVAAIGTAAGGLRPAGSAPPVAARRHGRLHHPPPAWVVVLLASSAR